MGILYMPTAIFSRLRYGMTGFSSENDPFTPWNTLFYVRNMPVRSLSEVEVTGGG